MFLLSFRTQKTGFFSLFLLCCNMRFGVTSTKWSTVPVILIYIVFKKFSFYFKMNADNCHYEHPSD